jgi:hypothetical protein
MQHLKFRDPTSVLKQTANTYALKPPIFPLRLGPQDHTSTNDTLPPQRKKDNTAFGPYVFSLPERRDPNVTIITPQDQSTEPPRFSGSFKEVTFANTVDLSYDERHSLTHDLIRKQ